MDDYSSDFAFIDSQIEEFEKIAFVPKMSPGMRGKLLSQAADYVPNILRPSKWSQAGKGRLAGVVGTGALGAGAGAATAEEGNRGAGAISGALAGGALGLVGGQLATGQGRRQVQRFGQRQAHAATGYLPGTYKKEQGILSAFGRGVDKDERLAALRRMKMSDVPEEGAVAGLREAADAMGRGSILKSREGQKRLDALNEGWLTSRLPQRVQKAIAGLPLRRDVAKLQMAEKGMTSMPGYLKNLALDPKAALATGALTTGAFGGGLPMALSAPQMIQAVKDRDPEELGASLAENAFYATSGPMPMLGQMVLGGQARRVGGIPGSIYKKLTGKADEAAPTQYAPNRFGPTGRRVTF